MFFPTALEKLKQFATTHAKIPDLVSGIIGHVAARIETEYGRLKPQKVERDTFDQLKFKILTEIDKGNHFRYKLKFFVFIDLILNNINLSYDSI